jgi:hypothetical protein
LALSAVSPQLGQERAQRRIVQTVEQLDLEVAQASMCTRDHQCKAEADEHEDACPVELELREVFGF